MKRPALTAALSALASLCAAAAVIASTGGISSATALSSQSSASAPSSQTDPIAPPPAISAIEIPTEITVSVTDAGAADAEPPPPPPLTDDPPSAEKSPRPKRAEWKNAPPVGFARSTESLCNARRIREWVLVKCSFSGVDGFSLIAGTREGVDVWMNTMDMSDASISIEFPVRRGDRRVFQINAQAGKYGSSAQAILSERWSESDEAPLLSVMSAF